jgi:hypothetical protein
MLMADIIGRVGGPLWHNRRSMPATSWSSRFVVWTAVLALLLKGAVPMLASAAAQWQGKTVAEVCTVYGVALASATGAHDGPSPHHHPPAHGHLDAHSPAPDDGVVATDVAGAAHGPAQPHDGGSGPLGVHGGDHCALTALAVLAPSGPAFQLAPTPAGAPPLSVPRSVGAGSADDCALWVARQKHGPPVLA